MLHLYRRSKFLVIGGVVSAGVATVRPGNGNCLDVEFGLKVSRGRPLAKKLFRNSANQPWGEKNRVTTKKLFGA